MTPQDVLAELLGRVGAGQGAGVLINENELSQWPSVAAKTRPASSVICPGCERECVMPVQIVPSTTPAPPAAFIVCDKRSDINRVAVSADFLTQWQCSADAVAGFVADDLGLGFVISELIGAGLAVAVNGFLGASPGVSHSVDASSAGHAG